jgi:protocatechuate 3,4-dioxygenase beta subunit
MIANEM